MIYFNLLPYQKVRQGFISWQDNFKHQNTRYNVKIINRFISYIPHKVFIKYRIDILLIGYLRSIFDKPITYDQRLLKLRKELRDLEQMDCDRFYKDWKNRFEKRNEHQKKKK